MTLENEVKDDKKPVVLIVNPSRQNAMGPDPKPCRKYREQSREGTRGFIVKIAIVHSLERFSKKERDIPINRFLMQSKELLKTIVPIAGWVSGQECRPRP